MADAAYIPESQVDQIVDRLANEPFRGKKWLRNLNEQATPRGESVAPDSNSVALPIVHEAVMGVIRDIGFERLQGPEFSDATDIYTLVSLKLSSLQRQQKGEPIRVRRPPGSPPSAGR